MAPAILALLLNAVLLSSTPPKFTSPTTDQAFAPNSTLSVTFTQVSKPAELALFCSPVAANAPLHECHHAVIPRSSSSHDVPLSFDADDELECFFLLSGSGDVIVSPTFNIGSSSRTPSSLSLEDDQRPVNKAKRLLARDSDSKKDKKNNKKITKALLIAIIIVVLLLSFAAIAVAFLCFKRRKMLSRDKKSPAAVPMIPGGGAAAFPRQPEYEGKAELYGTDYPSGPPPAQPCPPPPGPFPPLQEYSGHPQQYPGPGFAYSRSQNPPPGYPEVSPLSGPPSQTYPTPHIAPLNLGPGKK